MYAGDDTTGIVVRMAGEAHDVNPDGTNEMGDPTTGVLLDWSYTVFPVALRLLPEEADASPYLPEVLVVTFQTDAELLTELDSDHLYGWRRDGGR